MTHMEHRPQEPPTLSFGEVDPRGRETLNAWVAEVVVSSVTFKRDAESNRLELIQVDTPDYRRRGHARQVMQHLGSEFPTWHIINSPDAQNSEMGDGFVASLRREGLRIHDFGCYRYGYDCRCSLVGT